MVLQTACVHKIAMPRVENTPTSKRISGLKSETVIILPAHLDGKPLNLLVDTGSTSTLIFERALAKKSDRKHSRKFVGLDALGQRFSYSVSPYRELIISEFIQAFDGEVVVSEGSAMPFDGLIGMDILPALEGFIDFRTQTLILNPEDFRQEVSRRKEVALFTGPFKTWFVKGTLGEQHGVFELDSGMQRSSVVLYPDVHLEQVDTVEIQLVGGSEKIPIVQVPRLEALGLIWENLELYEHSRGESPTPENQMLLGTIGMDLLHASGALIDLQNARLYVEDITELMK